MTDADGGKHQLYGVLCIPADADGPVRLAVLNHGSPAKASDRPTQQVGSCNSEPAQWMLSQGFAVLYAQRRGYGRTGGAWAEGFGSCDNPDFVRAGRETARDIAAIVDFGLKQPGIRPDGAIVAGVSAGGWGTIAYNAMPHPKVAAVINVSGGRGGHQGEDADENCDTGALAAAAGTFGKTASAPMIWIYAENDTFFDPDTANGMYQAYSRAGGKAEFHPVAAFDDEGHSLWAGEGGSEIWGPLVEAYLKKRGVL
ncbi:MAG: prolyl oligopeptidase family serine peptidase [Alphaproteobacteria bacterium]|nr:prolyl oligopeptidase family serine peptidase [Alphaproteobacteria bacterium]MBL6939196.1 prolyl oligopeptidase family serine peptidase [Alphaproteobacteria bacterium]MBL7096712.1 prolyl oligopeptidase family serine peptidase [Alphaproteobacteria bacterium]